MIRKKYQIHILFDKTISKKFNPKLIKKAVKFTLEKEGITHASLGINFTTADEIHHLNKTYRNIDKTTDVLAFSQGYIDPETGLFYLGDIVISFEQAKIQAEENNRRLNEELVLLTIHGTLHLLGYDHLEPEEKRVMWEKQENILTQVLKTG